MAEITYLEAIREALFEEMDRDANVFCLGEDIGAYGFARLQIAAASPIGGVVNVARPLVVRRLRIRTKRPPSGRSPS